MGLDQCIYFVQFFGVIPRKGSIDSTRIALCDGLAQAVPVGSQIGLAFPTGHPSWQSATDFIGLYVSGIGATVFYTSDCGCLAQAFKGTDLKHEVICIVRLPLECFFGMVTVKLAILDFQAFWDIA